MILICLFAFTGCGQKKVTAYQSYVKNLLDVNYKGDYTNYVKQNKGNETDALALYPFTRTANGRSSDFLSVEL